MSPSPETVNRNKYYGVSIFALIGALGVIAILGVAILASIDVESQSARVPSAAPIPQPVLSPLPSRGESSTLERAVNTLPNNQPPGRVGGDTASLLKQLEHSFPETLQRIQEQIDILDGETLEDSLEHLSDIDFFLWPGPPVEMPSIGAEFSAVRDRYVLYSILCSRRVLKLLDELENLPSDHALDLLRERMAEALPRYEDLYEREWARINDMAKQSEALGLPGAVFYRMGGTSPNDIQLAGARREVLTLVLLLGRSDEPGATDLIKAVADRAIFEYDALSADDSQVARTHLALGSIYSPLILGNAILGSADATPSLFRDNVERLQLQLTKYDALLTIYDKPTLLGAPPDFSRGVIEVNMYVVSSPEGFRNIVNR